MAAMVYIWWAFVVVALVNSQPTDSLSCPQDCSCLGSMVDCSKRGLIDVPTDLPTWVKILDLTSNAISTIRDDAFKGLEKLEEIDLSNNAISSINETVFHHLRALKELKLNLNRLSEIPKLGKNSSITKLYLHNNEIHTINPETLETFKNLRILDLNSNRITGLKNGTFPANSALNHLFINNNKIIILENGCLDNLTSLEWLKLNKNKISKIKGLFNKLKRLKHLELKGNKISKIDGLTFEGLDKLQTIRLKHNSISQLMDGAFWGLPAIQNLQLDHNNISVVSNSGLYGLNTLKELSLSHNNIKTILTGSWKYCQNLLELDLTNNKLTIIKKDTFASLGKLQELYLDHNQIFLIYDDSFQGMSMLEVLEINNNNISWTIEEMNRAFAGLENLKRLGLDNNHIKSIAKHAFVNLQSLRRLHLSGNPITSIQANAFGTLTDLQELRFNSTNLLCDCQLSWLSDWLIQKSLENSVTAVCSHPVSVQGKSIFNLMSDTFICDDFPLPRIVQQPLSRDTVRGQNISLKCMAASGGSYDTMFQWKKNKIPITDAEEENFASEEGDVTEYTTILHLRDVQMDMAGSYQCVISNQFGSAYSKRALIVVHEFPSFTMIPSDVTVKVGKSARLECAAKGQPPPRIAWQKDGGEDFPAARERRMHVMPTSDVFFITAVKSTDQGMYSCTATNSAGTVMTNFTLTVYEKPSFVKPMTDPKFTVVGETTVLECHGSGAPTPKRTWLKDDEPLKITKRHFLTGQDQLLIIVETEVSDAGVYKCEMTNTVGTVSDTSELKILSKNGETISNESESSKNGGLDDESTTTGIIIIAVVCCVVGTSLVWVIIIYQTRKRHEEYSTTPTDETTLPGELGSSSYNSSDKEGSLSTGPVLVSGYHYPDYQSKESGYESISGKAFRANGWGHGMAMFPGDVDSEDNQQAPLTLDEQEPGVDSGGNSVSSLTYPNSESDTLKSSHSTSSTHTSGNQTLRTFHPHLTNHDTLLDAQPCESGTYPHSYQQGDIDSYPSGYQQGDNDSDPNGYRQGDNDSDPNGYQQGDNDFDPNGYEPSESEAYHNGYQPSENAAYPNGYSSASSLSGSMSQKSPESDCRSHDVHHGSQPPGNPDSDFGYPVRPCPHCRAPLSPIHVHSCKSSPHTKDYIASPSSRPIQSSPSADGRHPTSSLETLSHHSPVNTPQSQSYHAALHRAAAAQPRTMNFDGVSHTAIPIPRSQTQNSEHSHTDETKFRV